MEITIALITMAALCAGYCVGLFVHARLPAGHLTPETKDVVKAGVGAIVTLAGLVLGLLVASIKGSFDTKADEIHAFSANLIEMDRVLAAYGQETDPVRAALRQYTADKLANTWPDESNLDEDVAQQKDDTVGVTELEAIGKGLMALKPGTPEQTSLQSRALDLYSRVSDARWTMASQRGSTVQGIFLIIVVFWLSVMFTSFGLFAPRNATAAFFTALCAASFAGAIYIILEMDGPFSGLVTISSEPMRQALASMGH